MILAAVTSLVDAGLSLLESSDKTDAAKAFITALAAASVLLSWATVHSVFTLRYASLYYTTGGGIDFNEDRLPTYGDLAYLAFTIGMTYQVSDLDRLEVDPPDRPASWVHVVPLRHRRGSDHDQSRGWALEWVGLSVICLRSLDEHDDYRLISA